MNHLNANLLHHDTVFSEHSESNPDTAKNIPRPKFSFFRTRNRKIPPTASPGTRPSPAATATSLPPRSSPPACYAPPRFPAAKAAAGPPERPFTPPQPHSSPAVTETPPPPRSRSCRAFVAPAPARSDSPAETESKFLTEIFCANKKIAYLCTRISAKRRDSSAG